MSGKKEVGKIKPRKPTRAEIKWLQDRVGLPALRAELSVAKKEAAALQRLVNKADNRVGRLEDKIANLTLSSGSQLYIHHGIPLILNVSQSCKAYGTKNQWADASVVRGEHVTGPGIRLTLFGHESVTYVGNVRHVLPAMTVAKARKMVLDYLVTGKLPAIESAKEKSE